MATVYDTQANAQRRERAADLGQRRGGYTATEVALAYLLHNPFPLVPVVGPRTRDELASCVRATTLALSPDEIVWLQG